MDLVGSEEECGARSTYRGGGDAEAGGDHSRPGERLEDAVEVLDLSDVHLGELETTAEPSEAFPRKPAKMGNFRVKSLLGRHFDDQNAAARLVWWHFGHLNLRPIRICPGNLTPLALFYGFTFEPHAQSSHSSNNWEIHG